jgi:hypothetical protein
VSGLNVNGQSLQRGDEVPEGALSAHALQQAYERPLRQIERIDFAFRDPDLRVACESRGVIFNPDEEVAAPQQTAPPQPQAQNQIVFHPDPESLNKEELMDLCRQNGIADSGSQKKLLKRLQEHYTEVSK